MDDDYGYDEGSDVDNWEAEQVFQDDEGGEDDFFDALNDFEEEMDDE